MHTAKRLRTLDVFRGLTIMLMILVNTPGSFAYVYPLMEHAQWSGCTLADLVFPFFLFAVGFSGFLSCRKYGGHLSAELWKKIFLRLVGLFLLGILFNMYPYYDASVGLSWESIVSFWQNIRIFGVLQRIALAYFLGMLLCCWLGKTVRIMFAGALLLLIQWVGFLLYAPEAPFVLEHNLSQAIDLLVPGAAHIYQGFGIPFDPEGLYGTLTSAVNVMIGYLAGRLVWKHSSKGLPIGRLTGWGLLCFLSGLLLGNWVIICKALWTPSYVLLTSGIALLLFALLLYLLDEKHWLVTLMRPAQAFGTNPLFFFFASAFVAQSMGFPWFMVEGQPLYDWIYQTFFMQLLVPEFGSFVFGLVYRFLCGLVAEWLYRCHIFLKI